MHAGNLIKKVDDDESAFLDEVARDQAQMEKVLRDLVAAEVMTFRTQQGTNPDTNVPVEPKLVRIDAKPVGPPKRDMQRDIITSGLVRKKVPGTASQAVSGAAAAGPSKAASGAAAAGPSKAAKTAAGKAPAPAKQAPGSSGPAKATPAPKAAAGGLGLDYGSDDEDAS